MLIALFTYEMKVNVPYFKYLVQVTFKGLNVLANLYIFFGICVYCDCADMLLQNVCSKRIDNNRA